MSFHDDAESCTLFEGKLVEAAALRFSLPAGSVGARGLDGGLAVDGFNFGVNAAWGWTWTESEKGMKAANATSAAKAAKGPEEEEEEEEGDGGEEVVVADEERDVEKVEEGEREAEEVVEEEEDQKEEAAPRKKRKVGLSLRSPALGWSDILLEPVAVADFEVDERYTPGMGLHSSTFRLNVTHFL